MKEGYITIKCRRCGTEYEMPNLHEEIVMNDCPHCNAIDATRKKKLGLT